MKIKITRTKIIIFAIIFISILLATWYLHFLKPINSFNFNGIVLYFRSDLRRAEKIPAYPDEDTIYNTLINQEVENLTIAFKPTEKENAIFAVQSFEIVNKIYHAYRKEGIIPTFNALMVDSYEDISGSSKNPVIALIPPTFSNITEIRATQEHVVFIKAANQEDFDLATIKLLMIALKIKL